MNSVMVRLTLVHIGGKAVEKTEYTPALKPSRYGIDGTVSIEPVSMA
jgi:hypothetical protein